LARITNDELEKLRLNFSRCANCDVAPLISVFFFTDRRGGNSLLMLPNSSLISHRKFQDMADNVSEVKSTLFVHENGKSTVCLVSMY